MTVGPFIGVQHWQLFGRHIAGGAFDIHAHLALVVQRAEGGRERLAQGVHQCHLADHGSLFATPERFAGIVFAELDFLIAGTDAVLAVDLCPAAEKSLAVVSNGPLTFEQLAVSSQHDHASFKTVIGRMPLGHLEIAVLAKHNGAGRALVFIVVVDQVSFLGEGVQVILLAGLQKDLAFSIRGFRLNKITDVRKAHGEVLAIGTGDLHRNGRGSRLQSRIASDSSALHGAICQSLRVGNRAGCGGRRCARTVKCHNKLPPKLFDRTIAETALGSSLLEPCDIFPGELHPEAIPFAGGGFRLYRLCKTLQHPKIQPAFRSDGGIGLRFLRGFCLDLTLFLGGRANDRCSSLRTLCGLPFSLCAALGFPCVLTAAVLHKSSVQIQVTQVFRGAGFGVLAAGLPDQAQLFPPGLHTLAQLPACLRKVIGFVEPLGHQQAVKGDKLTKLTDTVRIDGLQCILLVLPLGFLNGLNLSINGPRDLFALALHLLGALQKLFQRLHVKGFGAAGGIAELLVQLVHSGAVGFGVLDSVWGIDAPGISGQHFGQILLHLGFVPPDRGQLRVLYPDGQFILHKYSPRIHNVHVCIKHTVKLFRLSLCQFIGNHNCI
nr:MAG TPA: hypothetical protein [Caudoviricetes sp.]